MKNFWRHDDQAAFFSALKHHLAQNWVAWVYGAVLLAYLLPLVVFEWPIGGDYLSHVPRIYMWQHLAENAELGRFYMHNPNLYSNWGLDGLVLLLTHLVGHGVDETIVAGRMALGTAILAYGISCAWLFIAAHGRLTVWALVSLFFAIQYNLLVGMMSQYLGQSLLLAFLGWLLWRKRYHFGWWQNIALVLFATLTFLCHAFAWGYCLMAWGLWLLYGLSRRDFRLFSRDSGRSLITTLCLLIPGVILFLLGNNTGYVGHNSLLLPPASEAISTSKLGDLIWRNVAFTQLAYATRYIALFFVVLPLIAKIFYRLEFNRYLVPLAVIFLGMAIAVPKMAFDSGVVDLRFAQIFLTLYLLGLQPVIGRKDYADSLGIFIVMALVGQVVMFGINARTTDHEVGFYRAAFSQLESGKKLLVADQMNAYSFCALKHADLSKKAKDTLCSAQVDEHQVQHPTIGAVGSLALLERAVFVTPYFAHPSKHSVLVQPEYADIAEIDNISFRWEMLNHETPQGFSIMSSRLTCYRQLNCPMMNWRQDFDYIVISNLRSDFQNPAGLKLLYEAPDQQFKLFEIDHSWQEPAAPKD
jgi:hypothetical protein